MILKHFAFGIGFFTCTFFAAEKNSRSIKFDNKSSHDLAAYYYNEKGNNAHQILRCGQTYESNINRTQQDVVVSWEKHDLQHKISFENIQDASTVTILPAIALKIGNQQKQEYTFLAPELSPTKPTQPVAVVSVILNGESSSSPYSDD